MAKQESANTINMHGGIYINNIEHIEHFHAPTDNSTDNSSNPTQVNNTLVAQESLINDLMPIFNNKEEEVQKFISAIKGQSGRAIANLAKLLVDGGVISQRMSRKPLFEILQKHNLYTHTQSNWNQLMK